MKFNLLFVFAIAIGSSFAQNGKIKTTFLNGATESELTFINDVLDGECKWFWENGNIKIKSNYSDGVINGLYKEFYPSGIISQEIFYRAGIRDGLTKLFYKNGGLHEIRNYRMGELLSFEIVPYDSSYIAPEIKEKFKKKYHISTDDILCNNDICAEPLGGIESLYNLYKYPIDSLGNNLEGVIIATIFISKSGKASDIKIIKSLDPKYDEEFVRILLKSNYLPSQDNGSLKDGFISIKFNVVKPDSLGIEKSNKDIILDEVKDKKLLKVISYDGEVEPKMIGSDDEFYSTLELPLFVLKKGIKDTAIVVISIDGFGFVRECAVVKKISPSVDSSIKSALYNLRFNEMKSIGDSTFIKIKIEIPIDMNYIKTLQ